MSSADWESELLDCLACILNDIGEIDYRHIVMGCDLREGRGKGRGR